MNIGCGDNNPMGRRGKIIAQIEQQLAGLDDQPGRCLFYAHRAAAVLWRHRLPVVVQAGSLQWPRVRREEDDGRIDTHFGYMWTPGAADSALSVALGNLPEMHVWLGLLDTQEIVDFSTRHLRAAAEARGMVWTAAEPPPYLWCPANAAPDWVCYRPNRDASVYACTLLKRLFDPPYLKRPD